MTNSDSHPPGQPDDLAQLRATFPGWEFESTWAVAGTGPDQRRLLARKGDVSLSAWTADDLAAQVVAAVLTDALRNEEAARIEYRHEDRDLFGAPEDDAP
jgi:hypothetical protein